jgi:hypothetical protein
MSFDRCEVSQPALFTLAQKGTVAFFDGVDQQL